MGKRKKDRETFSLFSFTPGSMSPEQAKGQKDLFSVGIIFLPEGRKEKKKRGGKGYGER